MSTQHTTHAYIYTFFLPLANPMLVYATSLPVPRLPVPSLPVPSLLCCLVPGGRLVYQIEMPIVSAWMGMGLDLFAHILGYIIYN